MKTLNNINKSEIYSKAERNIIAKALSELSFEGIISFNEESINEINNKIKCKLVIKNVSYTFEAHKSIWDYYHIFPQTIEKETEDKKTSLCAFTFFLEIKDILEIDDITLAHFFEEMHQSLFAECQLIEKNQGLSIHQFAQFPSLKKESYLFGHPKILLNKGRLGFNSTDFQKYSPESEKDFKLKLILVKKESAIHTKDDFEKFNNYLIQLLINPQDLLKIKNELIENNIDFKDYILFPVHPWQLDKIIFLQFQKEIKSHDIIILNHDSSLNFLPQISTRTLSEKNGQIPYDIKVSLNILNTSAYRGMSEQSIISGNKLSNLLQKIIIQDSFLSDINFGLLKEVYGASYTQNHFKKLANAPYRYYELLGFILREKDYNNLNAFATCNLNHVDNFEQSYAGHLITQSKIPAAEWIKIYTQKIILPLYHLQLKYGIGVVAHGQNILISIKNSIPHSCIIKDFQGDLRLSTPYHANLEKLFPEIANDHDLKNVKTLPKEHLIHDLITGHFISHLRFMSLNLEMENIITEKEFYNVVACEILNYLKIHHPYLDLNSPQSLLRKHLERIVLNKVRFKVGYADTSERLTPMLGPLLQNPLKVREI